MVRDGLTIGFDSRGFAEDCDFYFLSHAHVDHMAGLKPNWRKPVYCSEETKQLLVAGTQANIAKYVRYCPSDHNLLTTMEEG